MVTRSLQQQLELEANWQVIKRQIEDELENGKEYARLTKTPYQNLMLDKWDLKKKEKLAKYMSFLP
jgi:hypothetical protein